MKLIQRDFVAVRWADAHSSGSVTEYAEHELPHRSAHYTRYGFIMRNDEFGVTLANEESDQETYRGIDFIPRAMIVSVEVIKTSRVRVKKVKEA